MEVKPMLHNVPTTINRMTRNVVANHPNSFTAEMYRKHTTRRGDAMVAGRQTMGGAGVLDSGDEEDYEFEFLGYCYALPAENFQPAKISDRKDVNIGANDSFSFLIEPESESGEEGFFIPRNHDVLMLLLWTGVEGKYAKLAFEIVGMETTSNIPPYTTRWICNRRDDLHLTADGEFLSTAMRR